MTTLVCQNPSVARYLVRQLRRAESLGRALWGVIFLEGSVYVRVRGNTAAVLEVVETAHVRGVEVV